MCASGWLKGGSRLSDRAALTSLARELLDMRCLLDVLPVPLRAWFPSTDAVPTLSGSSVDALSSLLQALTERLALPRIGICVGRMRSRPTIFEALLGERIQTALPSQAAAGWSTGPAVLEEAVGAAVLASFEGSFPREDTRSEDGIPLRTYASRGSNGSAIVLVPPCGMPAPLLKPWMQFLSAEHFVMTWESGGLFGHRGPFERANCSIEQQSQDLFRVMDHYGVHRAHLMGSCGGAVIALDAAARQPSRVSSLSLWHGAFELGSDAPKTEHERNLIALLKLAAEDRLSATAIRGLLCGRSSTSVVADVAHLVLYPFANDELMYRYALINGALLEKDVRPLLRSIAQPTLVVTSEKDKTAHPEASSRVAALLPNAHLHIEPEGDHLSHFRAETKATQVAASFLRTLSRPAEPSASLTPGIV